jgi:hypothetical protein
LSRTGVNGRSAISADPVQHQVMVGYGGASLAFERDDFAVPDNTRHRHECVAAHAIEVIVMSGDQLQSGSPIIGWRRR